MKQLRRNQSGFTLIEVAIAFAIIALLIGSGLAVVSAQVDQQKFIDTQKALAEAKEALIGFAASATPAHLPCPDRTAGAGANDGLEDRGPGTTCAVAEGNLPWATLGITGLDAWGHRFRYRVSTFTVGSTLFTDNATGIRLSSVANLTVNDNESVPALVSNAPAVILSHGKNGWGATTAAGVVIAIPPATNLDERLNTDNNTVFMAGKPHDSTAARGEFDDVVTWLSGSVLINRTLQAKGTLPP